MTTKRVPTSRRVKAAITRVAKIGALQRNALADLVSEIARDEFVNGPLYARKRDSAADKVLGKVRR